jgi:hypothetical protein
MQNPKLTQIRPLTSAISSPPADAGDIYLQHSQETNNVT